MKAEPDPAPDSHVFKGIYQVDGLLKVRGGATLPARCVYCNAPVSEPAMKIVFEPLKRNSPALPPHGLIGAVIQMALEVEPTEEEKASYIVFIHRCVHHRTEARRQTLVAVTLAMLGLVGSLALKFFGFDSSFVIGGIGCSLILGVIWSRLRISRLIPVNRRNGYIYLKGASSDFLAGLPKARAEIDPVWRPK